MNVNNKPIIQMTKFLLFIEKYIGAIFVLMLGSTLKIKVLKKPPKERVIYSFWHRNIIPLLFTRKYENAVIMISSSKDGELVAGPCRILGFKTARGSSTRDGIKAMKKMIRLSKEHSIAITPDGPKGPREKVKEGLIYLAYLTKLPITPIAVDIKKEVVFNSWDGFRLPLPFSRVNISYGSPIYVSSKEEIEEKLSEVQKVMEELIYQNSLSETKNN